MNAANIQISTSCITNRQLQSSATCGAQPSRAKRGSAARSAAAAEGGRRRKAPGSRRRPPSLARASNKSTDASLLAATELVASKQPWSAGKRALHERDFYFMDFMWRYHVSKVVPERLVEDGVLGNLAPPGDLEESASHHSSGVNISGVWC